MDNIIYLQTKILDAFASKHHLSAIFLDIDKVYDMAKKWGVIKNWQGGD